MHPALQKAVEFFSELPKRLPTVVCVTRDSMIPHGIRWENEYHVIFLRNVVTWPQKISSLNLSIAGPYFKIVSRPGEEVDLSSDRIELSIRIEDSPDNSRKLNSPQKELESLLDETINALLAPEYIPIDSHQICERIIEVIKQVDKYQVSKHENMA